MSAHVQKYTCGEAVANLLVSRTLALLVHLAAYQLHDSSGSRAEPSGAESKQKRKGTTTCKTFTEQSSFQTLSIRQRVSFAVLRPSTGPSTLE